MKKEVEKRSTRGKRFRELTAEEVEADQEFWALDNDVWKEDGSDDSFSSSDSESDMYDSDFDESEDNDDEDEDEIRKDDDREFRRSNAMEKNKNSNRYVDPAKAKAKLTKKSAVNSSSNNDSSNSSSDSNNMGVTDDAVNADATSASETKASKAVQKSKKKRRTDGNVSSDNILDDKSVGSIGSGSGRSVRNSTKWKTQDADIIRKQEDLARSKKVVVRRPVIKHQYGQQELLLESLDTELENGKWLEMQKIIAADMSVSAEKRSHLAAQAGQNAAAFIKQVSRKGQNNTITFTSVEAMPLILRQSSGAPSHSSSNSSSYSSNSGTSSNKKSKKSNKNDASLCVITGLPAKYRDPKTMMPYATIEAYKEIKRKYHKKIDAEQAKGGAVSRSSSMQSLSSSIVLKESQHRVDQAIKRTSSSQSLSSASKLHFSTSAKHLQDSGSKTPRS